MAGLRAAGVGRADRGGALSDHHRDLGAARSRGGRPRAGSSDDRRAQHRHHRRAAQGPDRVRRQPAHRDPARGRPLHSDGGGHLARRARWDTAGGGGHHEGVHLHRRGRRRRRHHQLRRRRGVCADGQRDAGQPEELDPQPSVRVRPDGCGLRGAAGLPGVADLPDDGAGSLRLRHPAGGVLLQPGVPRAAEGAAQRGPLGSRGGAVPGRHRLLPAVPDQPRGRPRDRLPAP